MSEKSSPWGPIVVIIWFLAVAIDLALPTVAWLVGFASSPNSVLLATKAFFANCVVCSLASGVLAYPLVPRGKLWRSLLVGTMIGIGLAVLSCGQIWFLIRGVREDVYQLLWPLFGSLLVGIAAGPAFVPEFDAREDVHSADLEPCEPRT